MLLAVNFPFAISQSLMVLVFIVIRS